MISLRKLSIFKLDLSSSNIHQISSITNLIRYECDLKVLYYLLEHAPLLKYLHMNPMKRRLNNDIEEYFNDQ